jgi:hypothetical protein
MISRFFKRKPKAPEPKKTTPPKAKEEPKMESSEKPSKFKKLLTAEGWKRMMMRRTKK